eukprot:scaffold133041_cov31-Tisochrysis_lutea.AAC.4
MRPQVPFLNPCHVASHQHQDATYRHPWASCRAPLNRRRAQPRRLGGDRPATRPLEERLTQRQRADMCRSWRQVQRGAAYWIPAQDSRRSHRHCRCRRPRVPCACGQRSAWRERLLQSGQSPYKASKT